MRGAWLALAIWTLCLPVRAQTGGLRPDQPIGGIVGRSTLPAGWPPKGPAPRTSDGKPDLTGAWEPLAGRKNNDLQSEVKDVPLRPWAADIIKQRRAAISRDDPEGFCLPPGLPRANTTPFPFGIVQTPQVILILYEGGAHLWRQIFMDGRSHPKDPNPTWMGDSIGHWEDDTLVIDTVGFNGKAWMDSSGMPTTEALHVVERFRRIDLGHLEIEFTIDDPQAFTRPWKFTTNPQLLNGDLMEYICQENNRDLGHLVGK